MTKKRKALEYLKRVEGENAMKLEEGFYHLRHPGEPEPIVAYFYDCHDADCEGFGFNTYDGGGFLPFRDISAGTEIVKLKITEVL